MPATGRAAEVLELLLQCRKGVKLLAEENTLLREQLGLSDEVYEDSVVNALKESEQDPDMVTSMRSSSARPSMVSVVNYANPMLAKSNSSVHLHDSAGRNSLHDPGTSSPAPERQKYTISPLWKKGSMHNVKAESVDIEDDPGIASPALRINVKSAATVLRCPSLPLSPNGVPKLTWDMAGLILICWDVFYIPLSVLDLTPVPFTIFMDFFTLIFWTLDMVMSSVSGFYIRGDLEMSMRKIWVHYLTTWFLVDLIVVVPDWITTITSSGEDMAQNLKIFRAFRALRILRLLRLLKLQRIVNIAYDFISSEYAFIMIGMLRLVVFIIVLNHVIACCWFLTGKMSHDTGLERSWLTDTPNGNMLGEDKLYWYTTSLHWSLTQFTPASMEVSARNVPERILSIAVLFFALITFSSFVGSITTSMTALRSMRADTKKQFWMLRRYLNSKKISYATRSRIIKFLEFQSAKRQAEVSQESIEILDMLSVPLQNLLQYELRKQYMEAHPFFAYLQEHMRPVMIRLCSRVLKFVPFAPEDVVFRSGEESTAMYVVQSGDVEYHAKTGSGREPKRLEVGSNGWMAEASLWTMWWHRGQCTARSASSIGLIKPDEFVEIAKVHTASWNFCRMYAALFVENLSRLEVDGQNDIPWRFEDLQGFVSEAILGEQHDHSEFGTSSVMLLRHERTPTRPFDCRGEGDAMDGSTMSIYGSGSGAAFPDQAPNGEATDQFPAGHSIPRRSNHKVPAGASVTAGSGGPAQLQQDVSADTLKVSV